MDYSLDGDELTLTVGASAVTQLLATAAGELDAATMLLLNQYLSGQSIMVELDRQ